MTRKLGLECNECGRPINGMFIQLDIESSIQSKETVEFFPQPPRPCYQEDNPEYDPDMIETVESSRITQDVCGAGCSNKAIAKITDRLISEKEPHKFVIRLFNRHSDDIIKRVERMLL